MSFSAIINGAGELTVPDAPILLSGREKQLYIYRETDRKILYRWRSDNRWEDRRTLPHETDTIAGTLDNNGSPHMVILSRGGFCHLKAAENGDFAGEPFYTEESKLCSQLLMLGDGKGSIHLIYLAVDREASRWWLLHHRFNGETWEEPRVIDFGGGGPANYGSIAIDSQDTLHLVYRISEQNETALYYRYFCPETLNWSKAQPVATGTRVGHHSVCLDRQQNLHAVWCAAGESKYFVHYRLMLKAGWPAGGWKQEVAISPELDSAPFPFFVYRKTGPAMCWLHAHELNSFKFTDKGWEKESPLHLNDPRLLRCISLGQEGCVQSYWKVIDGDGLPDEDSAAPAPVDTEDYLEDPGPDFEKLQQYSESLLDRAASLSKTKTRLEQVVDQKKKELSWMARQNRETVSNLRQSLAEKDRELHELEEKFNQAVNSLKSKTDQNRKSFEAEKKRYFSELQSLKKERRQFEQIMKEKENTISRLDSRIRQQEYHLKQLQEENEWLAAQLRDRGWSFSKFIRKLLHNKP